MNEQLKSLIARTRSGVYFSTKFISSLLDPSPVVKQSLELADEYLQSGKPIFYVAGALTNVDNPKITERYEATANLIHELGGLSYLPHEHGSDPRLHPSFSPDDIYMIDFLWGVVLATAVIVWASPPSLGVGVQLGWCDTYQIPTLLFQPAEEKLSRLAEAIAQRVTVVRYEQEKDWHDALRAFIEKERLIAGKDAK